MPDGWWAQQAFQSAEDLVQWYLTNSHLRTICYLPDTMVHCQVEKHADVSVRFCGMIPKHRNRGLCSLWQAECLVHGEYRDLLIPEVSEERMQRSWTSWDVDVPTCPGNYVTFMLRTVGCWTSYHELLYFSVYLQVDNNYSVTMPIAHVLVHFAVPIINQRAVSSRDNSTAITYQNFTKIM